MSTRPFNCLTCQHPLYFSVTVIRPFNVSCPMCRAVHTIATNNGIKLSIAGKVYARLSAWYDYPEYEPYRVGPYRAKYSNGSISAGLIEWTGDRWRNGPVLFQTGSIIAWQGLGGEMEHLKHMPYEHTAPIAMLTGDDAECD